MVREYSPGHFFNDMERYYMIIRIEQINLYIYIRYMNPKFKYVYLKPSDDLKSVRIYISKKKREIRGAIRMTTKQFEDGMNEYLTLRKKNWVRNHENKLRRKFKILKQEVIMK